MTVGITRRELDAGDLRREAGRCRDARAARRMLALALVLEGCSRETAARHAGMERQTLRDRVHRHNAEGLVGLRDRGRPGRKPRLTPGQEAELVAAVERGPDPDRDGVVRWRRVDLQALIETRFDLRLHERSVGGQGAAPARPRAALGAPEAPAERSGGAGGVQEGFAGLAKEALPEHARGKPVEVWSGSKMRPASASRARSPASGRVAVPGPGRRATAATPGPTCSGPSARSEPPAPGWCCPMPTRRR